MARLLKNDIMYQFDARQSALATADQRSFSTIVGNFMGSFTGKGDFG
jgi:hypothetical protein